MSSYTHALVFTVRPKETSGADVRVAPEIDSDGAFRAASGETIVCSFESANVSFARKVRIDIPSDATPRQRAKLERKIERQDWEHIGTLKRARFIVTSLRLVWIAKHKGDVWVGFSPKGLIKAAGKTLVSSAMAAGKWDIGQVLLMMLGGVGADGGKRLIFTFADPKTTYRVDVEKIAGARDSLSRIHSMAAEAVCQVYERRFPHKREAIDALRVYTANAKPSLEKGAFVGYSIPYVCMAPLLPERESTPPSASQEHEESTGATNAVADSTNAKEGNRGQRKGSRAAKRAEKRAEKKRRAAAQARRFRRWIKVLTPPAMMAIAILRWVSSIGMGGKDAEYMATSSLCVVGLGLVAGLALLWILSSIRISRGALGFLGFGVLGFAAWQEWGDPWRAPLQWTYELSWRVQDLPLHATFVLRMLPGLAFALFMMALAWVLLMREPS